MAEVKTYLLAPNFQHKPDGALQIGNIIADPFRPAKVLSKAPVGSSLAIDFVTEYDHESSIRQSRKSSIGVWVRFLQSIGVKIPFIHDANCFKQYLIDRLETHYLCDEPFDNDPSVLLRLAEPRVQIAIKSGFFCLQPVYMITGIKIARGFTVQTQNSKAEDLEADKINLKVHRAQHIIQHRAF